MNPLKRPTLLAILVGSIGLTGCLGSSNDSDDPDPRPQQVRINQGFFTIDESALPFDALGPVAPYTTTAAGAVCWTAQPTVSRYRRTGMAIW
ncbi:hypothetical protein ULF88_25420 [Halopseudomonas pachastrellae]|nr:hypothetical protein [Halopseudomonas pachastrellae]